MKRSPLFWPSVVILIGLFGYAGAAVIPAIVPAAVPTANKTSTTGTVFALASSNALTPSTAVCTNANGDMTTTACTTNAVTSTTPVTVNANSTADQQLMELSLTAGYLNSLGRPFDFFGAGVYTIASGTPTLEFKLKLCTVSGCGSGTVVTLVDITSAATTTLTNNNWSMRLVGTTAATGATGNLEIHGPVTVDIGALAATADAVYGDINTAVSGNIDLTAALFVDWTIKFSTNQASPNAMTQREGVVNPGGSTAGGGGTTVTVAAPYITVAGTKYVAATMWPFTAFFSGSFLDAQTATLTAGANGSELVSYNGNNTNSWYSVAATTSIESELQGGCSNNATALNCSVGIWICDTTNGKVYELESINNATANQNADVILYVSWTLAACAGTPSAASVLVQTSLTKSGIDHFRLLKSGGNLLASYSLDAGQTYIQLDSRAVGTLAKAGVVLRAGATGGTVVNANYLSTAVN